MEKHKDMYFFFSSVHGTLAKIVLISDYFLKSKNKLKRNLQSTHSLRPTQTHTNTKN